MGQALSGQREQREGLLQKDNQYDEKALAKIAAKFNAEETCLQALLAEQLEGEVDEIAAMLKESLEEHGKQANQQDAKPSAPKPDLSAELASIATLRLHVASYLQRVKPEAIRERNKIKVKLTNVKRFVLSHLKNLYATQGLLLKEIDQLRQAYIDNFLRIHRKIFHNENKVCFDKIQVKRTRVQNFSQDSKKTTVSGPGSNQIHEVQDQGAHGEDLNLSHISAMENYEQESQNSHLNSSSCSEDIYLQEAEHEGAVFELYFTIYYTRYDSVQFPIFVYLTPRTESDYLTFGSPKRQKANAPEAGDDWNEPVFVGHVTSEFLFHRSKQALQRTYKSKTYVTKYALEAQSLMTYDCNSECIDFMLSKGQHKLADFLYSQVNTNSEKQPSRTGGNLYNGNNQLFDSSQLRHSIKFDIKNMGHYGVEREQATPGGAQDLILKLKISFVERIYLAQVQAQQKLSVRKQSIQDYELLKILGQGAFAKVLQVRHKVNGKLFAMKVIHKNKIMMDSEHDGSISTEELAYRNMYRVKQIISERNIFSLLNQRPHPFIVQLHSAFTSKNYLYLVLDLCPGGDLFNLIQRHKNFTPKQARLLFAEVVLAVEHLHNHDILYRDLKPENILIDEWGHLKLTDFGLSKENFTEFDEAKTICGSPEYFCPEILSDQHYGRTLDYYSLGVLLYELITGLPPYYNHDQMQMQKDIVSADLRVSHLSGDSLSLIQGLLEKDPSKRLGKVGGIKAIKEHPFFNEISWRDVRKKRYRYEKQYLKIDLTKTNFPFQQDFERKDQFDIGIDVEEECKPAPPKRRAADSKPLVLVEQRQIGKQRSKSLQQLSHIHNDLIASDAGDSDGSSSSSSTSSDASSSQSDKQQRAGRFNQGANQNKTLRNKQNMAVTHTSDEEDQDQQDPAAGESSDKIIEDAKDPNEERQESSVALRRAKTDVEDRKLEEKKAALKLQKRHTTTTTAGAGADEALQANLKSKQRDIIQNFKLNRISEVENEPKRSAGRAMSMRLSNVSAASAARAVNAAKPDQQYEISKQNRVGILREESIVPIEEMSEAHECDGEQTAIGMLQSASQNIANQLPGHQLNFEGFSYQLEFNKKVADFASSSQRDSLPETGKAGSQAESAHKSRVSSPSPSPGRVSTISNAQRDINFQQKSNLIKLQQMVDADVNKELNLEVQMAGQQPISPRSRASDDDKYATDQRHDGPARTRMDSAFFDVALSPESSARNKTVRCDRQQHMNRVFFPGKPKELSPEVISKRLSTEFGLDEDIKEADDKINIPLIQVVHRSATQTMNHQKQNPQPPGIRAERLVKVAMRDHLPQHSAQKSQSASVKQLSPTSSSEIRSNRSWDDASNKLEEVRVQMLSPQLNIPPLLAADEDIQYTSSHSSQYSEKRTSKMNSPNKSRTQSPGRLSRGNSQVLYQAAYVNDVLSLKKCPEKEKKENDGKQFTSNPKVSPDRVGQASRKVSHSSQRRSYLKLDQYARSRTPLKYAEDDGVKSPQKNAVIKTISTNLLTTFEENFEWNRPAASRRESKVTRLSRPDFSRKQSTEDLAETGPFKRHTGDPDQQPSSNIENSEQERDHQRRSKQLQESSTFDSRKRPGSTNRMSFQSQQHKSLAQDTETHNLIEYIDQFRNSLLNDEAPFSGEMRQRGYTFQLQSSKASAKSKGHVKNNKSLDPQQLKQKQQKMIAMKLMATNDVKIERKRRGTLQTALNVPVGGNGLMQVPANVQRKNFEDKFKRRQTVSESNILKFQFQDTKFNQALGSHREISALQNSRRTTMLQATELDQIVEDVDDLNVDDADTISCYQVTDQSVGQESKHSKMKNISLTAGKKRKSSTYLTAAQAAVLNSEVKPSNKSNLLSFQATKTRYVEGQSDSKQFSKRMSMSSQSSQQVPKATKQALSIPAQEQDPASLYNVTNALAPVPGGGHRTSAKTQSQPPSPSDAPKLPQSQSQRTSKSRTDGFHQRLASKHLHDSSDGDPTPAMSYDHSIQVQKHQVYSKETQSQQRNQNLKASGFNYTIRQGSKRGSKTENRTGGADDFYLMQERDSRQRPSEQVAQSGQLERAPQAKYESVQSMSAASSKAVSVAASSGPGAARYQNTRNQPAGGPQRQLSRHKPQQSSAQAAQPGGQRHIKASRTSQGTSSSVLYDRSSIITNEEISPRKIKMSERIEQKANLPLNNHKMNPQQKRKSQVITKQMTMPTKPLAPQASLMATRKRKSQKDNGDGQEAKAGWSIGLKVLDSASKFRQMQNTSHFKSPRNVLVHSGIKSPSMQAKGSRAPLPQSQLEGKPPNATRYGSQVNSPMAEHFVGNIKPPAWSCATSQNGSQDGIAGALVRSDDGSRGTRQPAPFQQQRPKQHAASAQGSTTPARNQPSATKAKQHPTIKHTFEIKRLDYTD